MSPMITELIGHSSHASPEASYSRRIGAGMAVLDAMIRDRGKLILQSNVPHYEHERLQRL